MQVVMEVDETVDEIEWHLPLSPADEWLVPIEEYLMVVLSDEEFSLDDGEDSFDDDGRPEYVYYLTNAPQEELLSLVATVESWPGVPKGSYCLVPDDQGEFTTRIDLPAVDLHVSSRWASGWVEARDVVQAAWGDSGVASDLGLALTEESDEALSGFDGGGVSDC